MVSDETVIYFWIEQKWIWLPGPIKIISGVHLQAPVVCILS